MDVAGVKLIGQRLWRRSLVVAALSAAAFAAPVLDLYGRNPEVFVANRASDVQIVLFGLLVTLVPGLIGLLLLIVVELIGNRIADATYRFLVVFGGAGIGFVVSRQLIPESNLGAFAIALAVVTVLFFWHDRLEGVLIVFSIALPVVLGSFLLLSPTSRLLHHEVPTVANGSDLVGSPSSIVFVQLDEFPTASILGSNGRVNEMLFPNFARLAESGTWYRNAFSASIATNQSVPATLTGQLGSEELSPTASDHPNNLFTLLGDTYEMHVIEWVAGLCPEEVCTNYAGRRPARLSSLFRDLGVVYSHLTLPPVGREGFPDVGNAWEGFLGQANDPLPDGLVAVNHPVPPASVMSTWIGWLQRIVDGIDPDSPPTLHYVHLESPHSPWRVNPSGSHYERPGQYTEIDAGDSDEGANSKVTRLRFQRHLYQLGFLDRMLGTLFDRLEETGNWDDALVVVVADHGASFVAGEHIRWPYENNRDDLYRVPLFVKYPGQSAGETRDEPAYAIDILPTVVDVLDISIDWTFDGLSLLAIEGTDRPHEIIHWCCSPEGANTDISVLFEQVERNHHWIPKQQDWVDVAAVGPFASLVGEQVSTLDPEINVSIRWSLDFADAFAAIDRSTGMVQTLITGHLELPESFDGTDLLIAVNGTIAGTGFTGPDTPNGASIRGLVAEELVIDGRNEVIILVPSEHGWLTGTSSGLSLDQ